MSSDGFTPHVERDEQGRPARLVFTRTPDKPVTGGVGPLAAKECKGCGLVFVPKRKAQEYHSGPCYDRAYNAAHPVTRQARLDFTPSADQLAHVVRGRESKAQRILARLQAGPATTWELARIGGIRFGARLLELRRAGHRIHTEDRLDYAVYSLEGE